MLLRKNIFDIILFFLFAFSAFFISNISKLSPIYFSIIFVIFFTIFSSNKLVIKKTDCKNQIFTIITAILAVVLVIQMFIFNKLFFDYLLYIISFLYLPISLFFFEKTDSRKVKKIIKSYYFLSSLILLLDFFNRIRFRDTYYTGLQYFYNFKKNGIMFQDSNFSAFLAMINFCFALYLKDKKTFVFSKVKLFILFALVFVNLSRAAILASLIMILFSWYQNEPRKIQIFLMFFFLALIPFVLLFLFDLFISDDSFGTKIDIFTKTTTYLEKTDFVKILFGNGIFTSPEYLGLSGHNYISQVIIEFGLIIFCLQIFIFFFLIFYSKGKALYVILPYLIAGLSMAPIVIPYFYSINALIILMEENKIK